ncbi:hypothetical protein [Clostridium ganghwense]|uniref:Uncharacterized protein n=1 Tax=Clostridium ganghwense TaxID=312089 RepID=A0ABT4CVY6_9CLOT|nr:hypothetical protein [Clostridium ganghwense]MCY6372196.1 hypothetical protein [Clostridium ganghwense]
MKKIFIISIAGICFLAVYFFSSHYISSIGVTDEQELINFISKKENVQQVNILKTKTEEGFLAAYYNNGTENRLIVLEEDNIFSNRYRYFGGSYSSSNFNTYNFGESSSWALIIVYGNNYDLKATSYQFCNNGNTYTNQNLGKHVLDIYKIEGTSDISSKGCIYDKNGNKISHL